MSFNPNRREFLKTGLATTAVMMTGGAAGLVGGVEAATAGFPDIVVSRGQSPAALARAAVDALGGMKRFVKPGNKVVIKPNMSFAREVGSGCNTNPDVVAEVARMCVEAGASKISVLDNVLQNANDCMRMSQIPARCEGIPKTTVRVVSAKRMFREAAVPNGQKVKRMDVISEALEADVLIAVPVGKHHSEAGVSLSMKGMMGLIYDRGSFHSRYSLHEAICDMVTVLKPHLVVVDGTKILTTKGPGGGGKVLPLNLVIASQDMVAADSQMVALGTWYDRKLQPSQVPHIRIAGQRGLGRMDTDKLNIRNIQV